MDYFNFEDASNALPSLDLDDCSSLFGETNEQETGECFEPMFLDKSTSLPPNQPANITKLRLINDCEVEVVPHADDNNLDYPMFRAKFPCDLCARNGMDCFLASRGTLITGCTCCISLYRECSFTHNKWPKGFVSTFPGISEDAQVCEGSLTEPRKALRSFEDASRRKTGARFPRDAVKILKKWLGEHADHPYPSEREKDDLKALTGLRRTQIANWLANARRRGKVLPASGPASPMLGAIDIPKTHKDEQAELAELNPLDRWKCSPPEHEPASMTAIAKAVTSTPMFGRNSSQSSLHNSRTSSRKASSEEDSGLSMFQAPSESSLDTMQSTNSDLSYASSRSCRSKGSFASSQDRRRRRRAPMTQRATVQTAKSRGARIFQCTFCTDTFPAKYDWQRHEKSLHLALERWTCCPDGGAVTVPLSGCNHCVFCQQVNPSAEHLESHNFTTCQEKTLQERTFYRKDHLRQHLKLMHNVKFHPTMEAWKSTTTEINSRCGFCPSLFTGWQQRADHLAAHFRNGADMKTWAGDWGFEPYVEKLVENAIPPYLIGFDRATMNPYVARASNNTPSSTDGSGLTLGTSAESSEVDQMTKDSNCFGRLQEELTKWLLESKASGVIPSDKEIQDYGRTIIYGDADAWDWTCADHPVWLHTFKCQLGLAMPSDPQQPRTIAEVPIMAPYVVKGGLKHRPNRDSCTKDSVATDGSFNGTIDFQANVFDYAIDPGLEDSMNLDLDSIDLSNLNLDMLDDGLGFGNTTDQQLNNMDMGLNARFDPEESQDVFGSFEMPPSMLQRSRQENNEVRGRRKQPASSYVVGFH